jgi:hypothetical protein
MARKPTEEQQICCGRGSMSVVMQLSKIVAFRRKRKMYFLKFLAKVSVPVLLMAGIWSIGSPVVHRCAHGDSP